MDHVLAKDLRESVLQAAFKGRLTNRVITDSAVNIKSSFTEEPPFDIPESWKWFNLGDLVWNRKQKTPDKLFSYIDIGSIDNINQKLNDSENLIEPNKAPSRARKVVEYGDIIYSTVRPYLHNMAIIDRKFSHEPIASTGFAAMVCNNGVLNKYLFLYLKSPEFDKYANDTSNAKGVAYPAINDKKLYAAAIPLPPIEEQTRIVARVDELMAKIDEYEKLENELIELKKNFPGDMKAAVLQAAMQGKLTEQNELERPLFFDKKVNMDDYDYDLPDNWTVVKMSSVSELYTGNSIPEAIKKSKYMGLSDGMNYIGTKDVGFDHVIDYENGVKIPFGEPKFKVAKKEATLLCVEGGSAGKKMGVIKEDVCFGNKLCSFNAGKHIDSKFQYYVIQSPIFGKMFAESISGMIGGVSVNKLKDMLIPLPPIEEQRRIVEKLDKILPLCEELEKEIA